MSPVSQIPDFLSRRPAMPTDAATLAEFDALFDGAVARADTLPIPYALAAPRWQFICHIAETRGLVLHGSPDPEITEFEPRQSNDVNAFGDRKAVYASSDGLWAMYFAILDRARFPMTLLNSALRLEAADGELGDPLYFFSITATALAQKPFHHGTLYFLPGETFEQQAPETLGRHRMHFAQWASTVPVRPLARITVGPRDFPLLGELRGHDDQTVFSRARADPSGFPWLDPA